MSSLFIIERGFLGIGGLIVLMMVENIWPFRRRIQGRWYRYGVNFFIGGSNALILNVLIAGLVMGAYHFFEFNRFGLFRCIGMGAWANIILTVVFLDGVTYLWHRAYHRFPIMWRMHRVHHSDLDLDVTTSQRFHMTEIILSAAFRLGVVALLGASFAGVIIFETLFGIFSQIEHTNIRIPRPFERWLRSVFVTPDMHRIHHSQIREHANSNFGTIFSWWDRLFKSFRFGMDQGALTLGLPEYPQIKDVSLKRILVMPFGKACGSVRHSLVYVMACVSLIGVGLAGGLDQGSLVWSESIVPKGREIELVYRAQLSSVPEGANQVRMWVPLAQTASEQEVLDRKVSASVPYKITKDPEFGNDILHLDFEPPFPKQIDVEISYRVRLQGETQEPIKDEVSINDARYSTARGLVVIDEEVRARADLATEGAVVPEEQARGIYDYVISNMIYDKVAPGWGEGDSSRACVVGRGNCTDFHSLFISMARASKMPARFKIGLVIPPESSGKIPGYHCWAEFFVQGRGWVPVDASEAWKKPELMDYYFGTHVGDRVVISKGRELQMEPKQEDGPVNIFFYPHVEVDGKKFADIETEFLFEEKKEVM